MSRNGYKEVIKMKRLQDTIALVLAAVLVLAPTVMAQVYHAPPGQRPDREPLDIEIWTNKDFMRMTKHASRGRRL